MLSSKRGCPKRINVDSDQVSIVPLNWSMDDARAIKQNSKRDSGSRVSRTGVNPHKIIRTRLDDRARIRTHA